MTALTEGKHAGGFIAAELENYLSRDTATVSSGQNLVDGQVVMFSSTNIVALTAAGTAGDLDGTVAGIVIGNWDATSGAIAGVPYISHEAFYKDSEVTFPTESTAGGEETATKTALKALHIRSL